MGFLGCVVPLVSNKVGIHPEGFPTFIAFIGAHSRVDYLMLDKADPGTEVFSTLRTLERFSSFVRSLVDLKVSLLNKGFPTFHTFIGSLSSMNSPMNYEV